MKFSIAIPAYKSSFLKDCISSILNQTYKNYELIIVNDCSPEPVDEIISQFNDERISYYKNAVNIGSEKLVNNWNGCLEKANGDFFVMMGDDDRMEPDFLEEFSLLIQKYPDLDVFHCRSKIIDAEGEAISYTPSWPEFESVYENIWHRISRLRLQYVSDFVYRTSTLKANGGYHYFPLAWGSDDVTAYVACGTKGIAHTNKPVFNYRQTVLTISSSGNHEKKIEAINMRKDWFSNFLSVKPANEIDAVFYRNICQIIDYEMQKLKVSTMTEWYLHKSAANVSKSISKRALYQVSFKDILTAYLIYVKLAISGKK